MSTHDFTRAGFQQQLAAHKLMGVHCRTCQAFYLPPRPMCTNCYSQDLEWVEFPGTGRLVAFTTVHIAPTAMIEAGYGRENPYCTGIVRLDNGHTISAQILGVDILHPENIKIGTALVAEFADRGEGDQKTTMLVFRPVV